MDKLTWMVNDLIEELMDLDMEPKPEWLWWTSTDKAEDGVLLKVGGRGEIWNMSVDEASAVLEFRFRRNGNVFQWRTRHIYRTKSVSLRTKFVRVVSHVCGTVFARECELAMEYGKSDESQEWMEKQEENFERTERYVAEDDIACNG